MRQHTIQTPYMVGEAHFYTTEIDGDLVMFDTGPATPEALAYLTAQVDLDRLKYLFITHCHVDHYGLAAQIAEHSSTAILLPRMDAVKFRRHGERLLQIEKLLIDCGFDDEYLEQLRGTFTRHKVFPTVPDRYEIVEDSDLPRRLGISWLTCPGHSQSDLVYLCEGYAITGDILLREIFQAPLLDVDLATFAGRFSNYDAYCASLVKLRSLEGYQILPGHRGYVVSLDEAIVFYVSKLMERSRQVRRFAGTGSVREVIRALFGTGFTDPFFVYLKASEIVFMRDFLAEPEKLRHALERIGLFGQVGGLYADVTDGASACPALPLARASLHSKPAFGDAHD
jgi:glyoxylase-like metal-dependent hydrolase (beta-lactamase superfamily II)